MNVEERRLNRLADLAAEGGLDGPVIQAAYALRWTPDEVRRRWQAICRRLGTQAS